jgi:hypothetical protein
MHLHFTFLLSELLQKSCDWREHSCVFPCLLPISLLLCSDLSDLSQCIHERVFLADCHLRALHHFSFLLKHQHSCDAVQIPCEVRPSLALRLQKMNVSLNRLCILNCLIICVVKIRPHGVVNRSFNIQFCKPSQVVYIGASFLGIECLDLHELSKNFSLGKMSGCK